MSFKEIAVFLYWHNVGPIKIEYDFKKESISKFKASKKCHNEKLFIRVNKTNISKLLIKMTFDVENWLWKLKLTNLKYLTLLTYINSQTVSLKHIHFIDKL